MGPSSGKNQSTLIPNDISIRNGFNWNSTNNESFNCLICNNLFVNESHFEKIDSQYSQNEARNKKIKICFACSQKGKIIAHCGCGSSLFNEQKKSVSCRICKAIVDSQMYFCANPNCAVNICEKCQKGKEVKQIEEQKNEKKEEIKHEKVQNIKSKPFCVHAKKESWKKHNESIVFQCNLCMKLFSNANVTPIHCNDCFKDLCYSCSEFKNSAKCGCGTKFSYSNITFICDQCGKEFQNSDRSYCNQCKFSFCISCIPIAQEKLQNIDKTKKNNSIDKSKIIDNLLGDEYLMQNLVCLFCDNILLNPKQCKKCRHHYCQDCIDERTIQANQPNLWCPNCLANNYHFIAANSDIIEDLNSLNFLCSKCSQPKKYSEIIDHEGQCK